MAYQSLYRRYRPGRFADVVGQDQVVTGLANAVRDDRVGHAYLFSGPRGTGKTSTARILAKALNCTALADGEPCGVCESCVAIEAGTSYDLQELDAASNNKVENIRDLVERVALGSPGRTKVYILDEVHMLSAGASNALLKTLEEPPPHVVFVLATTDPHKVLATIRSRTQHFEFHLLPAEALADHVRWVANDADIDLDDDGLSRVLRQGAGSARDTLSALDQIAAGGVGEDDDRATGLLDALGAGDSGAALAAVAVSVAAGREPRLLGESLLASLRDVFLLRMGVRIDHLREADRGQVEAWGAELSDRAVTRALETVGEALVEMRQAPDPRIPLEVALVRLTRPEAAADTDALIARVERLERAVAAGAIVEPLPAGDSGGAGHAGAQADADADTDAGDRPDGPGGTIPRSGDAPGSPAGPRAAESVRPADAARAALAASRNPAQVPRTDVDPAPPPPPTPTTPSPATTPPPGEDPPEPQSSSPTSGVVGTSAADIDGRSPRNEGTRDDPAPLAADAANPTATANATEGDPTDAAGTADGLPPLDVVRTAWRDTVLPRLTGLTKALFSVGRIGTDDGGQLILVLPNEVHRGRCAEKRGEVEAALAEHFGHRVPVDLVVGDTDAGGGAPGDPAAREATGGVRSGDGNGPEAPDVEDVNDLADAPPDDRTDVDRLTDAFPGSELLEEDRP